MKRSIFVALLLLFAIQCLSPAPRAAAQDTLPDVTLDILLPYQFGSPPDLIFAEVLDVHGTAIDPEGIEWVSVQIQRDVDGTFWNGSGWQASPAWERAILVGSIWMVPAVDFTVHSRYIIRPAVLDQAGNFASPRDTTIFKVRSTTDTTPPAGHLTSPKRNRVISAPPQQVTEVGDTIYQRFHDFEFFLDDEDGFGISEALTQVFRVDTSEFWNGSAWQSDPAWCLLTNTRFSRYALPTPVDLTQPGRYIVRLHLRDRAGNISTTVDNEKSELLVIEDTKAPTAFLTVPPYEFAILPSGDVNLLGGTVTPGVQIVRGKVRDVGAGADDVRVQIQRHGASVGFWNGASWQVDPVWVRSIVTGLNPSSRNWKLLNVDLTVTGDYTVRLISYDEVGNGSRAADNWRTFLFVE